MNESSGAERQEQTGQQEQQEQERGAARASQLDISSGYEDVDFGAAECAQPQGDNGDTDAEGDAEPEEDDDEEEDENDEETGKGEEEEEGRESTDEAGFLGVDEESGDAAAAAEREEQTAQELARRNRLAQTGYDVRALDTVGWTARYQAVMARPKSTARERMVCAVEERRLFDEFAAHAARIAQRLVHEINLPTAEKTIKPINSGGVAGGESLQTHAHTVLSFCWETHTTTMMLTDMCAHTHTNVGIQSSSWMGSTLSLRGTGVGSMGTTRWRRRRRATSC